MKKRHTLLAALLFLGTAGLTTACSDDDGPEPPEQKWAKMTQQVIYKPDGSELARQEYTYDAEGRRTGFREYWGGVLQYQESDYRWDGRTARYHYTYYDGTGAPSRELDCVDEYYDAEGLKPLRQSRYDADGTEADRSVYTYDGQGRPTGFESYQYGILQSRETDYRFEGRITRGTIQWMEADGVTVQSQHDFLTEYYDDNWYLVLRGISFFPSGDGSVSSSTERAYDAQGRETRYRFQLFSSPGVEMLRMEYSDYRYDGKKVEIAAKDYTDGSLTDEYKVTREYL